MKFFPNLSADIKRYMPNSKDKKNVYLIFDQGLWAVSVYRFGRWVRQIRFPLFRVLMKLVAFFLFKIIEVITGISIPASAQIGKGFCIVHFSGIILHSDIIIGENCSIGSGVIIGSRGLGREGVPTIGDNVYIGVGAKVLGPIKIGNGVRIGANALVISDLPDGVTAVGVPARILVKK